MRVCRAGSSLACASVNEALLGFLSSVGSFPPHPLPGPRSTNAPVLQLASFIETLIGGDPVIKPATTGWYRNGQSLDLMKTS
jgi:hypothetical protein